LENQEKKRYKGGTGIVAGETLVAEVGLGEGISLGKDFQTRLGGRPCAS